MFQSQKYLQEQQKTSELCFSCDVMGAVKTLMQGRRDTAGGLR